MTKEERNLALSIFDSCARIAHQQAGNNELDERVGHQWRACAISTYEAIMKAKNIFYEEHKELNGKPIREQ